MSKGEQKMAVVNYKVAVVGGIATIDPDPTQVKLRSGDFMTFAVDDGGPNVLVQVVPGTRVICAATGRLILLNPQINTDGDVIIAFIPNDGENPGGSDPFP
jgi:hypothetical protein